MTKSHERWDGKLCKRILRVIIKRLFFFGFSMSRLSTPTHPDQSNISPCRSSLRRTRRGPWSSRACPWPCRSSARWSSCRGRARPGANCIKLGLTGKLILNYYQENWTSRRPFLLLMISFPGRPILYISSLRIVSEKFLVLIPRQPQELVPDSFSAN